LLTSVFTYCGSFKEERVFLVEHVFREGNRYSDLLQEQFTEKFPETPCTSSECVAAKSTVYHDRPRTLNELKTAVLCT